MEFRVFPAGDSGLSVVFKEEISPQTASFVWRLRDRIRQEMDQGFVGIEGLIPSYCGLVIQYDPMLCSYHQLSLWLEGLRKDMVRNHEPLRMTRVLEIPVLYGEEYGLDLDFVCEYTELTPSEVIERHTKPEYLIYMLGFTPGFPYLGGMDKTIATPRLKIPRVKITAGSVGIAGEQTGIYPIASPGGWQIIGNTPVKLYDPKAGQPILLDAGEYLRFRSISREEYEEIKTLVEKGEYQPVITHKEVNG